MGIVAVAVLANLVLGVGAAFLDALTSVALALGLATNTEILPFPMTGCILKSGVLVIGPLPRIRTEVCVLLRETKRLALRPANEVQNAQFVGHNRKVMRNMSLGNTHPSGSLFPWKHAMPVMMSMTARKLIVSY